MACYTGKDEGDLLAVPDFVAPSPESDRQASGTPSRPADGVAAVKSMPNRLPPWSHCTMQRGADTVIGIDVASDASVKILRGPKLFDVDVLGFEAKEPTLDHDVILPAGLTVHALSDTEGFQKLLVVIAGKLTALVRVKNCRDVAVFHGGPDCVQYRPGIQRIGERPTDDLAAEPVNNRGQIHVSVVHLDIGDIDGPDLIWKENHLVSQQVWHNRFPEVAFREIRFRVDRMDAHLQHTGPDQLASDVVSLTTQQRSKFPCLQKRHHCVPVVETSHDDFPMLSGFCVLWLWLIVERRARYSQQFTLSTNRQLRICSDQAPGWVFPCGESSPEESPAPA